MARVDECLSSSIKIEDAQPNHMPPTTKNYTSSATSLTALTVACTVPPVLLKAIQHKGSELLVNVPLTCPTSEEGGVNVWTLPLSVVMDWKSGDEDERGSALQLLLKRGAAVDVWDYLGKSVLA
eukprot:CAMPEP_0113853650 /NCGR_PEP_ID=MMETSP0372-20130328/6582_1 /TAXON_ID=340204 /ORGANISM="Lankesteria abbotti" /LENGTH=123 /DNA_ID=CAMNT_0000826131 /DNA_START=122 /DNA_END=489 /DNA_ORIENTATION=+ /assembly_acc=CAM_ASM_000359